MKPNTYVFCPVCNSMTQPFSNVHWCKIEKEGQVVRQMKKRWDSVIGAWVLADDDPELIRERKKAAQEEREREKRDKLAESFKGYKKSFVKTTRDIDVRDSDKYYDASSKTWRDLEGKSTEPPGEEERTNLTWDEYLKKRHGENAAYIHGVLSSRREEEGLCRHGLYNCGRCRIEAEAIAESGYQTCEIPKKIENGAEAEKAKFIEGEKNERGHELRCTCVECRPEEIKRHLETCHCHKCFKFKTELGMKVWWTPVDWAQVITPKPWDNVPFAKWPQTFHCLFRWYHESYNWYNSGRYISDEDYWNRILHGIYKPEPKRSKINDRTYYYGPYSPYGDEDWEQGEG